MKAKPQKSESPAATAAAGIANLRDIADELAEVLAIPPSTPDRVQAMAEAAKLYGQCMDALCPRYTVDQATLLACNQVKDATGIDLAAIWQIKLPTPKKSAELPVDRLVRFVRTVKDYAGDSQFTEEQLTKGLMPHAKLLKLMKMPADQFVEVVAEAWMSGRIFVVKPAAPARGLLYGYMGARPC